MHTTKMERAYGRVLNYAKLLASVLKNTVIHTECIIHKVITIQALEIIKNDNFQDAYLFFCDFIPELVEGVVWADQDLKCSGHFYSPNTERGLYGNANALSLAREYYKDALDSFNEDTSKSLFYLGAALHLVQDMTVPQHANIRLLNSHRQFENFIRENFFSTPEFLVDKGGYYMESIDEAVRCNARTSVKIYQRLSYIKDKQKRYRAISKFILPLAQRSTAGCLMKFYRDISKPF
ncbi:MAG TPA: zinc dependent phospholipase C family protein [Clostridia bacterium]